MNQLIHSNCHWKKAIISFLEIADKPHRQLFANCLQEAIKEMLQQQKPEQLEKGTVNPL